MKKAFDQTVRDLKREVNKKVLKVPGIEQKVLDATSNEPWGPHGSLLADIAQATRNYHEYQIIMSVIWKRVNDTGKNWRHVYKALTVLEYMVAHGSERVIDEIREHAYQISTLSDFQYVDSSGRDQGSNVRKKSQSLVVLVNDKERIQEVREKAATNRDKFRNTSMGGMYKPSSYSGTGGNGYDDDRNGYGRDREGSYKDDDRYGRYGDSYGNDGGRYSRDSDDRYGKDGFRDDGSRGRSRSIDDYQYSTRSRSSDRERDRAYEDDGQYSSRGSGARADDYSQEGSFPGKRLERKFSEQNLGAPPSYEEALAEARSPIHSERDGETSAPSAPKIPASVSTVPSQATPPPGTSPPRPAPAHVAPAPANEEVHSFDEFDPRGSFAAAPTTANGAEMDLLGSLAIVPVTTATTASEVNSSGNFSSGATFSTTAAPSAVTNQPFEDPFGDGPFKAAPSADGAPAQPHNPTSSFHPSTYQSSGLPQPVAQNVGSVNYGDTYPGMSFAPSTNSNIHFTSSNSQFSAQDFPSTDQSTDILADILPPTGPSPPITSQMVPAQADQLTPLTAFPAQTGQPGPVAGFPGQISSASQMGFPAPSTQTTNFYGNYLQQPGSAAPHMASQTTVGPATQYNTANFLPQTSPAAPVALQMAPQTPGGPAAQRDILGSFLPQAQQNTTMTSQPAVGPSAGPLAIVPQPSKEKFEPKSTVWADTLSRGLVNFNISGPKTNPLADIGIDFDAINRKEKRMEKPTTAAVTSTVNMGKAMGSGTGVGRAGAGALRPPPNPMVGSGMGMGMGGGPGVGMGMGGGPGAGMGMGMRGGPGAGMGMGGYGGMNQPMGTGMGMGMNMGMGQVGPMQPMGYPPGSTMPGGYANNPMMGRGGYAPQQPYGGGYR